MIADNLSTCKLLAQLQGKHIIVDYLCNFTYLLQHWIYMYKHNCLSTLSQNQGFTNAFPWSQSEHTKSGGSGLDSGIPPSLVSGQWRVQVCKSLPVRVRMGQGGNVISREGEHDHGNAFSRITRISFWEEWTIFQSKGHLISPNWVD